MAEKATPVTPDEADDIRVTLDLDNGSVECKIITIFDADHKDYIALLPLDKNGNENESGEVYLYRYFEDEEGLPRIENIESDDEYEAAATDSMSFWMTKCLMIFNHLYLLFCLGLFTFTDKPGGLADLSFTDLTE